MSKIPDVQNPKSTSDSDAVSTKSQVNYNWNASLEHSI